MAYMGDTQANSGLPIPHTLTAATCSVKEARGRTAGTPLPLSLLPLLAAAAAEASQRQRRFSFPPEARVQPSGDQARPHTSCRDAPCIWVK